MTDIAIRVKDLSKQYRIGRAQQRHDTLRDSLVAGLQGAGQRLVSMAHLSSSDNGGGRRANDTIWALKDISFEVKQGEVVGIIGRNGAGKSTLLKILSRITEPTEGRAEIHGRVGSLLEVGTGFHPELTGRENIYLSGAILGMHRQEIERRFDEIVAFSGVEKFLDTPIKRYSSGMNVRLGFAVAAHLEPEILLVDEVLAVGDAAFQRKCLGRMGDLAKEGRTVLFVSHNMAAVMTLCQRGIAIREGGIVSDGSAETVVDEYLKSLALLSNEPLSERTDRSGDGRARFVGLTIGGIEESTIRTGDDLQIQLELACSAPVESPRISVIILDELGHRLIAVRSHQTVGMLGPLTQGGSVTCTIPQLPLLPGIYRVTVSLYDGLSDTSRVDRVREAVRFTVVPADIYGTGKLPKRGDCLFAVPASWSFEYN